MSHRVADSLLSANLCDIYHYCVYSSKLLMMDRDTVIEFYSKNKFEKLLHLVGFIIRIIMDVSEKLLLLFPESNEYVKQ